MPQKEEIEGQQSFPRFQLSHTYPPTAIGKLGNADWTWENFHKYSKKVQRYAQSACRSFLMGSHAFIRFYPPDADERSEFKNLYKSDAVGHDGTLSIFQ